MAEDICEERYKDSASEGWSVRTPVVPDGYCVLCARPLNNACHREVKKRAGHPMFSHGFTKNGLLVVVGDWVKLDTEGGYMLCDRNDLDRFGQVETCLPFNHVQVCKVPHPELLAPNHGRKA